MVSTDALVDKLITAQGDFSLEFWHSIPVTVTDAYHPFTYSASTANPLVYHVDVDFDSGSDIYVGINNTVMQAVTTPPVFSSGWRHFALTYAQPYVILCRGAGFEVKQATNYNFNREFSLAMTFAASDVASNQGLLYKGTGSDITSPRLTMSYRVGISGGAVTLTLTDGNSTISPVFTGPAVLQADLFYQVIIVKHTTTPAGNSDSADPYAPPFDMSELGPAASAGTSVTASSLPSGGGGINITNIGPANPGATPKLTAFLNKIQAAPSKELLGRHLRPNGQRRWQLRPVAVQDHQSERDGW